MGYGSVFWFRAVSAAVSGAKVQTNILQVHKVHIYFVSLQRSTSVLTAEQVLLFTSQKVSGMKHNQDAKGQ